MASTHGQLRDYLLQHPVPRRERRRISATTPTASRRRTRPASSAPRCRVARWPTISPTSWAMPPKAASPRHWRSAPATTRSCPAPSGFSEPRLVEGHLRPGQVAACLSRNLPSRRTASSGTCRGNREAGTGSRKKAPRGPFSFFRELKPGAHFRYSISDAATRIDRQPSTGMSRGLRRMRGVR